MSGSESEYEIEAIVGYRSEDSDGNEVQQFEVKWAGFDSDENTWQGKDGMDASEIQRYKKREKIKCNCQGDCSTKRCRCKSRGVYCDLECGCDVSVDCVNQTLANNASDDDVEPTAHNEGSSRGVKRLTILLYLAFMKEPSNQDKPSPRKTHPMRLRQRRNI